MSGPGFYKKAGWARHEEQAVSSIRPWPLHQFLPCLSSRFNWGVLLSRDSTLCQVDIKPASTSTIWSCIPARQRNWVVWELVRWGCHLVNYWLKICINSFWNLVNFRESYNLTQFLETIYPLEKSIMLPAQTWKCAHWNPVYLSPVPLGKVPVFLLAFQAHTQQMRLQGQRRHFSGHSLHWSMCWKPTGKGQEKNGHTEKMPFSIKLHNLMKKTNTMTYFLFF
jgi:hypothetical protein